MFKYIFWFSIIFDHIDGIKLFHYMIFIKAFTHLHKEVQHVLDKKSCANCALKIYVLFLDALF